MSNFQFRSDQMVDELVQFNQNLSKGVKNLLDTDEISSGLPRVKKSTPKTNSSFTATSPRPGWYKTKPRC